MKIPSMNAFRGRKHAPKKSKSSRRAAEDPAETPPMVASSAQRRSSTTSRSRQHPSGRHVQEPEGCPATTIPLRPTQQDSSPTTPRQTNRTIISPRSSVDSPPQAPTTTLHRQKSPSSSKSTLSRRDYGRGSSGGGRSSREGRDRSTSINSNSIPEDAPVVDSRAIPPLPLRAQQQQQQQQHHQPPPPKRKSSQSSQQQQQQRRPSKELGLDHLSLLSPPPDPDNHNHNPTTTNIPSSSASINTIDTVTRSAAQLQSLIEQMQLEVTKLRSSKHAAECRANRLESDMERMTQEMENSVLKMGMENERLKGEVEGWRLRCEELEREVKRAAANSSSGSHSNSGGNVNGMNVESGKKECIQIKTKTSDGSNNNNIKQKRHRSSDLSSSNNSNTSINSKSSNSRRSSKSQCHSGTNITPTSSPLFGKELMALSYERATPKRNNKLESSAVKSSSSGGGSDHPPHHVKSRNNTHNNNNNEHHSSSSSSSSSSKAERTVDASSCASPYDHGGIWTPQGIKSGRMMDRQHDQMRSGGRGGEKVIDELVVDELYYA